MNKQDFIRDLYRTGAIKFGNFTLKSGVKSPYYIDLRCIYGQPNLMHFICQNFCKTLGDNIGSEGIGGTVLCGVPTAGIPYASMMSYQMSIPMVLLRKDRKKHGTGKLVEGLCNPKGESGMGGNDKKVCVLIEDVMTSGQSILESIELLEEEGCFDEFKVMVIVDRESGGMKRLLAERDIEVYSMFKISEIMEYLKDEFKSALALKEEKKSFSIGKRIREIMALKKSNLVVSADLNRCADILKLVEQVGERACVIKLHCDIIEDFNFDFIKTIQQLATKYGFLILEDRKFTDIGSIVIKQFSGGFYKIATWADLVTVHAVAGEGTVAQIAQWNATNQKQVGVLLIDSMSSKGNLISQEYTKRVREIATKYSDTVVGFITQNGLKSTKFLNFTPGINLDTNKDGSDLLNEVQRRPSALQRTGDDQRYITPAEAIMHRNTDLIIVGRGIYQADLPKIKAEAYSAYYDAYEICKDTRKVYDGFEEFLEL